jgi:hypothetical protein
VSAQLALALLAVGPLKSGVLQPPAAAPAHPKPAATTEPRHDPIAFLAREWLAKR